MSNEDQPRGWVKPQREPTLAELKVQIAETEERLRALKQQEFNLEQGPRLEAMAQIRNIMRAQQLTVADITQDRTEKRSRHAQRGSAFHRT